MIVYLDTSALIKLVFDEAGSDLADELWDRADAVVGNRLLYPEARAAVAAARRGGRIDDETLRTAVAIIDDLHQEITIIDIDASLARRAGELAEQHGLRGYDAVHLAAALSLDSADLVVATWDVALGAAARRAGCSVSP